MTTKASSWSLGLQLKHIVFVFFVYLQEKALEKAQEAGLSGVVHCIKDLCGRGEVNSQET